MTYVSIMAWPGFKANLLQESHGHKIIILTLSSKSYICLVFDMIPNNNAVNGINDNGHISSSDNNRTNNEYYSDYRSQPNTFFFC